MLGRIQWMVGFPIVVILLMGMLRPLFSAEPKLTQSAVREQFERDVDQVAAASQEKAIAKLSHLLKKYRNTGQEPILLSKLADLQQQYASILFRIAHGATQRMAAKAGKAVPADYTRVSKVHLQAIATLTALISKYPSFDEIPHAYYLRAKSYEEVSNKSAAMKDYEYLVTHYPKAEETPSAYMSLADFAIEANDHPKAIGYLRQVEKLPDDPHYPFALFKLAWSHYNLKEVPEALGFIERHIVFIRQKAGGPGRVELSTSDQGLLENSLLDAVLFYSQGYEDGRPQYRLSEAMPYFRKLDQGPAFAKMLLRMTKILRSHNQEADLIRWKDQVLAEESSRPESLDVLLLTYEYIQGKRRYSQLVDTARDIVRLYGKHSAYEGFKNAQRLLLETADELQKVLLKNKGSDELKAYSMNLAAIYDAFTRIVEDRDPRVPGVHHNLAETLFAIQDYAGATEHYRWVVQYHLKNGTWDSDVSLKSVAARYEVLNQKQLTAKEIKPRPLKDNTNKAIDPLLTEWVSWIDQHFEKRPKELKKKGPKAAEKDENFLFEANRALYAQGKLVEATERMLEFAQEHPESRYAIPSASLVVDTLVVSQDWKRSYDLSLDLMDVKAWKGSEFNKKLGLIAADSYYKMIEGYYAAKDYKTVIKETKQFSKKFPNSQRLGDCLGLAGRSALALSDKDMAKEYFSRLIADAPKSANLPDALLARALIAEERYELASAAEDYRSFLAVAEKAQQTDALRRKTLMLTWLAGDPGNLRAALNSKVICTESLASDCDRFTALSVLASAQKAGTEDVTEDALKRVKDQSGENRTIWATVALEGIKYLSFRDRLYLLRQVASGWNDTDPLVKFTLLPYLSLSIPKAFEVNRLGMNEAAPLRANERYISRRVEVIREMENAATKVMKLPWARIRAEVLNEIAALYIDLSRSLAKLPPPKNLAPEEVGAYEDTIRKLVLPFEEKGQEMRSKAFEIASRFSVDDVSFDRIAGPFFAENPSQAKALNARIGKLEKGKPREKTEDEKNVERFGELDLSMLAQVDPDDVWSTLPQAAKKAGNDPKVKIKALWAQALQAKQWGQVAYFMQEAHEKKISSPVVLALVRAVSMVAAGARAEGLTELDAARKDLASQQKFYVTCVLLHYSVKTLAHQRSKELLDSISPEMVSEDNDAAFLASVGALMPVTVR